MMMVNEIIIFRCKYSVGVRRQERAVLCCAVLNEGSRTEARYRGFLTRPNTDRGGPIEES